MEQLPEDIKREIIRFIPRHDLAQIIHDSRCLISLTYVRRWMFDSPVNEERIWGELNPVYLRSIFYGDTHKITRSKISKGQIIKLKRMRLFS
tara:strand:+ start:744 stop:1019 length:276 start_codon:yes stop_codon:yes gene_type:complete